MAATDDKDGTTADATDKPNEQESSTLISVLTSMKSSIDSGNSLLLELVNRKRSSPDGETESAKRRKTDTASQKASTLPSDEDEHEASEKANTPHQHDADDADKLSLFGADSDNEEDVDLEDSGNEESENASLLSEISSSLSCSEDTGPLIADSLAELINGKFNADFSVEKRKEILQKYKKPSNCEKVLVPKINEEIWSKLPSNAKRSDIKMSALQDTLVKVSSAIICSTDKLLEHREKKTIPNYKALINPLLDSVALLGHVCTELSYKRRDALKSFLHQDFRLAYARSRKRTIAGETIEFSSHPFQQSFAPNSICKDHVALVEEEICSLNKKGVIVPCDHDLGEFISPIFTVPKKDANVRLILNLKKLNTFIQTSHFKMDSIHTVLKLVTPNCWMASLDLKDAYYSVRIHPEFQKFLKFFYHGTLYKYSVFPNGLCICPKNFAKMMKPPFTTTRSYHIRVY